MATREHEKLARELAEMGRDELTAILRRMHCEFDLDFTDEFLGSLSLERLRHIVLAAMLHDHSQTG
ncbi:MAG: hypothetical protein ACLFVW_04590 [Phycisphaerae bacterium]